ncbi:TetR/AcrR family transcriptional regulator [Nonomuraea sediminis]|uniref:TetR/AcrR family transcriptional regulator n=1 Tax=Nonomuraea sediminis TaxID=2835864 RepID=UPI0027E0C9A5|nr:TetR/AcrR family transcriptional regulator [Nonomuraea sediminis]
MPRPSSRERLLDAAGEVLLTQGADALTLEAVAQRAGVSKGGLFYHFPTKQALVDGLVRRLTEAFDAALGQAGERPGDYLRAYLDATIPEEYTAVPADRLTAALLAGVLVDPAGLEPLRERFAAWQDRLTRDGLDPAAATAIRLAVDGWWAVRMFGLGEPGPDLHARTRRYLLELIERAQND